MANLLEPTTDDRRPTRASNAKRLSSIRYFLPPFACPARPRIRSGQNRYQTILTPSAPWLVLSRYRHQAILARLAPLRTRRREPRSPPADVQTAPEDARPVRRS